MPPIGGPVEGGDRRLACLAIQQLQDAGVKSKSLALDQVGQQRNQGHPPDQGRKALVFQHVQGTLRIVEFEAAAQQEGEPLRIVL